MSMPCVVPSALLRKKSNVRSFSPALCASNNTSRDSFDCAGIEEMRGSAQTTVEAAMYKQAWQSDAPGFGCARGDRSIVAAGYVL
jgi:hypothetical protein